MYKGKKILALIPARGGSKGLPGKNIMDLCGKPLVAWTIGQAKKSRFCDQTVVSTDDRRIALISKKHGGNVPFMRPKNLAKDTSPTTVAIEHALRYFEKKGQIFDYVALLEPTSPLRRSDDIDKAIKKLIEKDNKADSLVSLGEIALEHPFIAKKIDKKGRVKPFYGMPKKFIRRQELGKAYFPYGVIYLSSVKALRRHGTFYQKRTVPYFIERWQNYEIDDVCDFICVEAILKDQLLKTKRCI